MRALPWIGIVAGIGIGFVAYVALNFLSPQYATVLDDSRKRRGQDRRMGPNSALREPEETLLVGTSRALDAPSATASAPTKALQTRL